MELSLAMLAAALLGAVFLTGASLMLLAWYSQSRQEQEIDRRREELSRRNQRGARRT